MKNAWTMDLEGKAERTQDLERWFADRVDAETTRWRAKQGLPEAGLGVPNEQHILACTRVKARKVWSLLPAHYVQALEQNQLIASCCRHPENHDVEAWFSCEKDAAKGVPDIYKFHCTCGRVHARFCVGEGDEHVRPVWGVRWWRLRVAIRALVGRLVAGNARPFSDVGRWQSY